MGDVLAGLGNTYVLSSWAVISIGQHVHLGLSRMIAGNCVGELCDVLFNCSTTLALIL